MLVSASSRGVLPSHTYVVFAFFHATGEHSPATRLAFLYSMWPRSTPEPRSSLLSLCIRPGSTPQPCCTSNVGSGYYNLSTTWLDILVGHAKKPPPLPSPAARRSAEDVALMVDLCQQQCCELDLTWPGPIPLPPLMLHAGLRTIGFMPTTNTFMLWLAHALVGCHPLMRPTILYRAIHRKI